MANAAVSNHCMLEPSLKANYYQSNEWNKRFDEFGKIILRRIDNGTTKIDGFGLHTQIKSGPDLKNIWETWVSELHKQNQEESYFSYFWKIVKTVCYEESNKGSWWCTTVSEDIVQYIMDESISDSTCMKQITGKKT